MKVSKYLTVPCALHITEHDGKLTGIPSINVSTRNKICDGFAAIPGSICAKCYARRMESYRLSLGEALRKNSEILSAPIADADIPEFKPEIEIARFDSFGEIGDMVQLENYVRIAEKNVHVTFALWTKRSDLVKQYGKPLPENIVLIFSHRPLFTSTDPIPSTPDGYDYSYAVYDKSSGVKACGDTCITCRRCYMKPAIKGETITQLVH